MRGARLKLLAVTAATLLAAGCGDSGATTTTSPPGAATPEEAVAGWAQAVASGDAAAIGPLVAEPQLALLVALDNSLPLADLAAMAGGGVPAAVAEGYWASFEQSFAEFAGAPLADLEATGAEIFAVDGFRFATVRVAFPTRIGSAGIVAAETAPERWQVDLLATLAPALLVPLRSLATSLPPDDDGAAVRALLADVLPSLRAAAEQPDDDAVAMEQRLELEALVRFLAPSLDG